MAGTTLQSVTASSFVAAQIGLPVTLLIAGLQWKSYNGYFNDDVTFSSFYSYRNGSSTYTNISYDFSSITTATNNNWIKDFNYGVNGNFSVEWKGIT